MVLWFLDIFFICFPIAWLWREKGFKPPLSKKKAFTLLKELGFKRQTLTEILKKTLLLFGLLLFIAVVIGFVLNFIGLNDTILVREKVLELKAIPWIIAYILVIRISSEEVFFRGFLVPKMGVLGSSVVFALAHSFYGSIGEIIGAFALGLLLSVYFKHSKTILPNIFAHCMYDLVVFSLIV